MEPPSSVIRSAPESAEWFDTRVEELLRSLAATFEALREAAGLPKPYLELVVAEDLGAAVRSLAGRVIGTEDLSDFSLERIGGLVVGKTLYLDEAHERAVVTIDASIFRSPTHEARVGEIQITAHELAHAFIGQLRASSDSVLAPSSLPWELTKWLARFAIEEYLADTVAEVVVGSSGFVRGSDGSERKLTGTDSNTCAPDFIEAVGVAFESMRTTIHDYRLQRLGLVPMWNSVQSTTSNMLISLAHAQAELDTQTTDSELTNAADSLPAPVVRLWSEFLKHLSIPMFDGSTEFARRETESLSHASDAILAFWRELGLTFRPESETFYITVAGPEDAWPHHAA